MGPGGVIFIGDGTAVKKRVEAGSLPLKCRLRCEDDSSNCSVFRHPPPTQLGAEPLKPAALPRCRWLGMGSWRSIFPQQLPIEALYPVPAYQTGQRTESLVLGPDIHAEHAPKRRVSETMVIKLVQLLLCVWLCEKDSSQ